MGRKTRDELITAGQGRAGNLSTALATRLGIEFQAWLDRQYKGWKWPFLKKRATGIALSQGATSLTIGAGNGGITLEIASLISPIGVYTSDRSVKRKSPIIANSGSFDAINDETLADSATYIGTPLEFKAREGTVRGAWDIVPLPFPDRNLLLAIDYYSLPAAVTGSDIPRYPDDSTMIQAIFALALEDQKGSDHPQTAAAMEEMGAKVARDRMSYGSYEGDGDLLTLDSTVFR